MQFRDGDNTHWTLDDAIEAGEGDEAVAAMRVAVAAVAEAALMAEQMVMISLHGLAAEDSAEFIAGVNSGVIPDGREAMERVVASQVGASAAVQALGHVVARLLILNVSSEAGVGQVEFARECLDPRRAEGTRALVAQTLSKAGFGQIIEAIQSQADMAEAALALGREA